MKTILIAQIGFIIGGCINYFFFDIPFLMILITHIFLTFGFIHGYFCGKYDN